MRAAPPPAPAAQLPGPAPDAPQALPAGAYYVQSCLQRGQAYLLASSAHRTLDGYRPTPGEQDFERGLQEKLEQIQAWLDRPRSDITAEFEKVRALCDVVRVDRGPRMESVSAWFLPPASAHAPPALLRACWARCTGYRQALSLWPP